jgi:hypothetical protein
MPKTTGPHPHPPRRQSRNPQETVGVHFRTRNRTRFESAEPTDAEARQARAYLGYYTALARHRRADRPYFEAAISS